MPSEPQQRRIPRPVPACDWTKLPISPQEAFLLSRVDGTVSDIDLALMVGLPEPELLMVLERLAQLGAVTWDGRKSQPVSAPSNVATQAMRDTSHAAVERGQPEVFSDTSAPVSALYDPSELDEDVDLAPEKRRKILDVYYQLEQLSHYEVLGIDSVAEKKVIKDAYFRLASENHPDRFFRKRLGSFKPKMEAIFTRITVAHDTLVRRETREEYDAYLSTQRTTRQMERDLRQVELDASPEQSKPEPVVQPPSAPTSSPAPAPLSEAPPRSPGVYSTRPPISSPSSNDRARRDVLAARLSAGRSSKFPPPATSTPPGPTSAAKPSTDALEELRRQRLDRTEQARRLQLQRYVESAELSDARNDSAAAANAYRLALGLAPDDDSLRAKSFLAQKKASALLADGYLKQAQYEARAEQWKEAARSYARAADGMKDRAEVQHSAAHAMLRADLDLHKAAEYAKAAVALDPKNAKYHANLAQIYLAAGLPRSALRELEVAAGIAPDDDTIAKLLRAVKRS